MSHVRQGSLALFRFFLVLMAFFLTAQISAEEITLVAVGDITLGNHFSDYDQQLQKQGLDDAAIAAYPFLKVKDVFAGADLVVGNFEGTLTTSDTPLSKNFNFKANPAEVKKIQLAGIHMVTLANNHIMDWSEQGLTDTIRTLDAAGILHTGAGVNLAAAREYAKYRKNGLGLCLGSYLYLGASTVEPAEIWALDDKAGAAGVAPSGYSLNTMKAMLSTDILRMVADADCQIRVVYFHWGREGRSAPKRYQRELARVAVDNGADLVLGSHPHVVQGVETLTAPDGSSVPVVYSMGNFVFAGNWNPKNKKALMVKVRFNVDGKKRSRKLDIIPVFTDNFPASPFQPYVLKPLDGYRIKRDVDCRKRGIDRYCDTDEIDDSDPQYDVE